MAIKFTKHTLNNGVQIFLYNDNNKHGTIFSLITKFGGINGDFILDNQEYHINNGMAHLMEHLLMEHSIYGNISQKLGQLGMYCNALTDINQTRFYFETVEQLDKGIEIMLTGINQSKFTEEDVLETKPAVYEEIRIGNDNKEKNLFRLRNTQLFKEIPYIDTIGTYEEVASFDYELIKKCYQAFYQPENQVIVICGKFNSQEVLTQIEQLYNQISKEKHQVEIKNYLEPKEIQIKYCEETATSALDIISVSYKINIKTLTPKEKLELDFYLAYFSNMNFGIVSDLYKNLSENKIAHGLYCNHLLVQDFMILTIEAFVNDEQEFITQVTETINYPTLDEELFKLYQKTSIVQICIRPENLNQISRSLIDNIINFNYLDIDTVKQIKGYNFKRFKQMIEQLDFSEYVITKLKNEK